MANLPDFRSFDCEDLSNAGPRWKKWLSRFEVLMLAMNLKDTEDDREKKRNLLLHYMGDECYDIYETLKEESDKFSDLKDKLISYFVPKSNSEYEKYIFRNSKQEEELRKKALTKSMNLTTMLETGKAMELAKDQLCAMESESSIQGICGVSSYKRKWKKNISSNNSSHSRDQTKKHQSNKGKTFHTKRKSCFSCGGVYPHAEMCPAYGRRCYNCSKYGHFARFCKEANSKFNKPKLNSVQNEPKHDCRDHELSEMSSESHEYILSVNGSMCNCSNNNNSAKVQLKINNVLCSMLIDSGASVNVLDYKTFQNLKSRSSKPCKLETANIKLYAYGSRKPLSVKGKFHAVVTSKCGKCINIVFYVVRYAIGCLLSFKTASDLGILKIINSVSNDRVDLTESILRDYNSIFQGLGKLKNFQLKLNIDDSVNPVHQKHRRVPFKMRQKVESAVAKLCDEDICESVENCPTPWVSPIVCVPKPCDPENIRLCVDMRAANKAIKRVKHPMPPVDELIHDLNGYKVFSKLDLNQGYHQIELHPDSRHITTFSTHIGLYRYKRLNYGVNAASEKFQYLIEQALHGLRGVKNISDDIYISSVNEAEHEKDLRACLQRIRDCGLTLNRKKCSFFQSSIKFFGNMFGDEGVSPDPNKVEAINKADRPSDKQQVKSFLDASPVGLGCVLVQKESDTDNDHVRVIAYASRLLSDVESRYSQIEREALAVCWAIEHFHLYLYGVKFTVVTDHKPLVSVFSSVTAKPSARIERWCLRLQQYTFNIVHRPGKTNPADYMSRHPIEMQNVHSDKITEECVNYVCENTCPKAIKLCEIKSASENDSVIQNVIKYLQNNLWYKYKDCEEMSIFAKIASELCVTEQGILLRSNRIVIPVCLRRKIVDIAHEGHMGMSKTKSLLREKIWFPGMDAMVENVVKSCAACASVVKDERMLPLSMSFPEVVKTDNGPPWQSYQFRRFMELFGIRHRKITPLWPRANAQSENFMKPLGRPPAELLYGTNIKVLLPEIIVPTVDNDLRDRDCFYKAKQKMYADARNCSKPTEQIHVDVLHDNDISDDTVNLNADNETADPIAESPAPSVPPCSKYPSKTLSASLTSRTAAESLTSKEPGVYQDPSQISEKIFPKPSAVESSKGGSPSPAQERQKVAKSKGSDIPGTSGSDHSGRSVEQGAESNETGDDQDPSQISEKSTSEPNAVESRKGGSPAPARKRQEEVAKSKDPSQISAKSSSKPSWVKRGKGGSPTPGRQRPVVAKSEDPSQISGKISSELSAVESSKGGIPSPARQRSEMAKSRGSDIPGTSGSDQSERSVEQRAESKESGVDQGSDIPGTSGSGQSGLSVEQGAESKETGVDPDPSQISEKISPKPSAVESSKGGSPSPAQERQKVAKSKGNEKNGSDIPSTSGSGQSGRSVEQGVENKESGVDQGSDTPGTSSSGQSGCSVEQGAEIKETGVDQDPSQISGKSSSKRSAVESSKCGSPPPAREKQGVAKSEDATSLAQSEEQEGVSNVSQFQSAEQHPILKNIRKMFNRIFRRSSDIPSTPGSDHSGRSVEQRAESKESIVDQDPSQNLGKTSSEPSAVENSKSGNPSPAKERQEEAKSKDNERNDATSPAQSEEEERVSNVPRPKLGSSPFDPQSAEQHPEPQGATAGEGENERFEDACTDILKRFPTFKHFKMFAQAGTGLALSINEISTIIEDNASSVEDQKFEMLQLWKEKNGSNATSRYIREVVEKHLKAENSGVTGSRIEDAFLDVPKVFANAAQFKRFALSRKGLSLSMLEVENIKDNARSVEERNLQMLTQWKYKNGESATTEKIWQLVDGFLNERDESDQDSPHPTTLAQSVEEERVSNVPLSSSLSQSADQLPKSEGPPGGEVARCEEPKRLSSVPSPQLGASPFGSQSSEPLMDPRGATGGEAASGSGSMTLSGAHEHQGTSATVTVAGSQIGQAHLGEQNISTQQIFHTTNIHHHYTPDRHRRSDTQPTNTSSKQEAAIGGGSYTEKVQEFKHAINDLTRRSAKPIEKKYLKTPDYKTNPKTVEVDYYQTTVQESEYKPEVGFSQQTQKQPGNPISMENFFSDGKSRVALIGGAGYGKTEMTKTYPINVLDGKVPELRKIEVVHRMDFRDLEVHRRISPKNFLFGKTDLNDDVIDMGVGWIRQYPERFLLVLDGADQYSSPESLGNPYGKCNHKVKADPKLILNLILAGKLYPGIRIFYSSREHVIRNFEGEARPERVIALAGFSKKDVIKLVKAFSADKSAYVMNRLQNEAKAIFSLCTIPMFLIFTVSVLIIYEQYSPDTMTEILLFVLLDTLRSEHITMNQIKTGMSIYDVVHSLKKMSFKGTKNKKVTFTKSDLPPGITVDHFKDIMIPFPGSIGLNQRLLEGHLVYLFTHQTIQEALTALYIAEMSIWKFRKFVSTKIHEKHWVVVRKILCGIILNPKTSNIAMEKEADVGILKSDINLEKKRSILLASMKIQFRPGWFQRKIKEREAVRKEDLLELMQALNESGDGIDGIIKSSMRVIDFGFMSLTPSDKYTLASILARCSRLDLLYLPYVFLTSSDPALLASSMQRSKLKVST
uniref:uncharacterized protein LOC120337204 n=1 Tax=Styela clava TaxID=7725 RepID=UPI0019396C2F|nr:uncharacterized protein LOC120337204 [Styela clava]